MISRVIALASIAACTLVGISFVLFARDQASGASRDQVAQLTTRAGPSGARASRRPTGQPRRFIDGAAHTLTSPFESIIASGQPWVRHGVPAVIALLVYGAGLGYLARYARGLS